MLTSWRGQVIALAAARHGINPSQAREAHLLPVDVREAIAGSRPVSLTEDELRRALTDTVDLS